MYGPANIQVETRISSGNSNIKCIFFKNGDFHGMYFPEGLIEYSSGNSNIQVETRISSGDSNVQVETRIFKLKLECSS